MHAYIGVFGGLRHPGATPRGVAATFRDCGYFDASKNREDCWFNRCSRNDPILPVDPTTSPPGYLSSHEKELLDSDGSKGGLIFVSSFTRSCIER